MLIYFYLIFFLYYVFVCVLRAGWEKEDMSSSGPAKEISDHFVSIVVAVRNEEKNILKLLRSIESQSYPSASFELIIVDDHSADRTVAIVGEFARSGRLGIRLMSNDHNQALVRSPKKHALNIGITAARGDIIMTTDGDCWPGKDWVRSMISPFENEKTMFISGPVAMKENGNFFSRVQSLEFSSLIGSGGALIRLGYPLMCNGANLAFRKRAFLEVGGYEGIDQAASGDDVYLMQKIHHRFRNGITFRKVWEALVFTHPSDTLGGLIHQRRRWASKWNSNLLALGWVIPVFLFVHYLSFAALGTFAVMKQSFLLHGMALIMLKFVFDYVFLRKLMIFSKFRLRLWVFLLSEILYPIYAIVIGILAHFGNWKWKDRKFNR
jgi:cellulose synthase/poly-beta-1,6-N-acetylglucosamine synthase-like glycosyltransferase